MSDVILVDENDVAIGQMNKIEAHEKGLLHRAFSVFIFNDKNELLLQKRAMFKYHSASLWSNTCCSHPEVGESIEDSSARRLQEEMGFTTELQFFKSFIYKSELGNGLWEHEFDHVLIGFYNAAPVPDSAEVSRWKYIDLTELEKDMSENPSHYTAWLKIIFADVKDFVLSRTKN